MTNPTTLYAFTLGREWKLSLAELFSLFWDRAFVMHSEEVAIFELGNDENDIIAIFRNIGGSIRVMRIISETDERKFPTDVISQVENTEKKSGKITFALWAYGLEYRASDVGLRIKKALTEKGLSVRLGNTENKNINAASWKNDRLGKSQTEYSLINIVWANAPLFLGVTLACQDIDAYARRDTGKSRDMAVGMMPPKLVQMMINLATKNGKIQESETSLWIYDPFSGLGTTLIEAANMGYTHLIGSDISADMVRATEANLEAFIAEEKVWQERIRIAGGTPKKDFSDFNSTIFELDAAKIFRHFEGKKLENIVIVSEWYLGEIMMKESITVDRVKIERSKLTRIYDSFFHGLRNIGFQGNIVMTFPFWDIRGTYSYFTEIYDVIEDAGFEIIPLLPYDMNILTKKWSLLYRRPSQNVGREIIKLRLKK